MFVYFNHPTILLVIFDFVLFVTAAIILLSIIIKNQLSIVIMSGNNFRVYTILHSAYAYENETNVKPKGDTRIIFEIKRKLITICGQRPPPFIMEY